MRIVIDMQGAQTDSRFRGIGRYTRSFIKAIALNKKEHEVFLVLNGALKDSVNEIRREFKGILPAKNIYVWYAPKPIGAGISQETCNYRFAEIIREEFIKSLHPDIVHLTSLFEGYMDNSVTSVHKRHDRALVSLTLYDLIPLLNREKYLDPNPGFSSHYMDKINYLMSADVILSISEFSKQECLEHLKISADKVVNVSTAIEPFFRKIDQPSEHVEAIKAKFGISKNFLLYTGGADERKNLPRLISAYAQVPKDVRKDYQLLLVGSINDGQMIEIQNSINEHKFNDEEIKFAGYVDDEKLLSLYNCATLLVFPSWHEGFGLPALEAMSCGLPVIAANTGSLPEVVGLESALFNPFSVDAIAERVTHTLQNKDFRKLLSTHGLVQAKNFSWELTAKRAISTWEDLFAKHQDADGAGVTDNETNLITLLKDCDRTGFMKNKYGIANAIALNSLENHRPKIYIDIASLGLAKNDSNFTFIEFLNSLISKKTADPRAYLVALDESLLTPKVWSSLSSGYSIITTYSPFDRPDFHSGDMVYIPIVLGMPLSAYSVEIIQELCGHGVLLNLIIWDYSSDEVSATFNNYLSVIIECASISGGRCLIFDDVYQSSSKTLLPFKKIPNQGIFKTQNELTDLIYKPIH